MLTVKSISFIGRLPESTVNRFESRCYTVHAKNRFAEIALLSLCNLRTNPIQAAYKLLTSCPRKAMHMYILHIYSLKKT